MAKEEAIPAALDTMLAETAAAALASIKKIAASKGRLEGNFYFAGDTKGAKAGLVVTLLARDPKGAKATSEGKKLRSEIEGAKICRGVVRSANGKAVLELHTDASTGTKDTMKIGFKKAYSAFKGTKSDGLKAFQTLQGLLRKTRIVVPGQPEEPEEQDETESTDAPSADGEAPEPELTYGALLSDLSAAELAEINELINDQASLSQSSADLRKSFLSAEAASQERAEIAAASMAAITELEGKRPVDMDALQAKRYALAESLSTGPDPFPKPGERLKPEAQALLDASLDNELRQIMQRIQVSSAALQEQQRRLEGVPDELREVLRQRLVLEAKPQRDALDEYLRRIQRLHPAS